MFRKLEIAGIPLVMLAACVLMLAGLGVAPLQDYDEATYAQVTHEMIVSGNYIEPTHTGEPYFEKPPLYFWAAAASAKLFGENEFALRLPSALAGIGLIAVVIALAFELSGSLGVGALAGAILLTMAPVAETARQVRIDVPLAFFIMLAAWAWIRAQKNPQFYLLFGVAVGLAAMTKDVIAIFAIAAAFLWAVWNFDFRFLRNIYFWWGIALFLAIVLPWHIYMTLQFGAAFWQEYLGYDVLARSAQDLFMVRITNADYLWYLVNFAAPWTQAFVASLLALWIWWDRFNKRARMGAGWTASMVALILAVFFYAATKAPTYLIPLYPFAAVTLALAANSVLSKSKIFIAAIALLLIFGTSSTIYNAFHFNPYYAQSDELAREEKTIGLDMKGSRAEFFAFQTTTLGSIMFYSGNTHPLAFAGQTAPGSFIVLPTQSQESLTELYPNLATRSVYQGEQLSLLQALP